MAKTPEKSDFTSIQERIRAWQRVTMTTCPLPSQTPAQAMQSSPICGTTPLPAHNADVTNLIPNHPHLSPYASDSWLCPIQSDSERRGILKMTEAQYLDLVDMSGRMMHSDRPGAIDADLAPILLRIGAHPSAWLDTISRFGSKFHLAAGSVPNLRDFAGRLGRSWFQGTAAARAAFASPPLQFA